MVGGYKYTEEELDIAERIMAIYQKEPFTYFDLRDFTIIQSGEACPHCEEEIYWGEVEDMSDDDKENKPLLTIEEE